MDFEYEIIVVNDGSYDNTLKEIRNIEGIICISYDENRGKGYAVKRGILRATGDYIFFSDSDLSFEPSNIGKAVELFNKDKASLVVGERIDKKTEYSAIRRFASYVLCVILRLFLGLEAKDSQCGFKGFDKKCAKKIFSKLQCVDFGFDFEALYIANVENMKLTEMPVAFIHNGESRVRLVRDSVKIIKRIMCLSIKNITPEKQCKIAFFTVFFMLSLFRFSYLGYSYTPYLDDYVQYILYPSINQPWQNVLAGGAGILFTRPLAGLADFFLWSGFDGASGVAVLIITVLYTWSAVLFYKSFRDINISVTSVFLIFYTLCPINIEGTYWLSASSRIVVSLFLVSLSCRFLIKEKIMWFWLCNAFSMCFYEQTAVLAFVMPLVICASNKKKRLILIPLINLSAICVYYLCFGKMGNNSGRISVVFSEVSQRILQLFAENNKMWGQAQLRLLVRGLVRGFEYIASDNSFLWVSALGILILGFFVLIQKEEYNPENAPAKIYVGLFLAAASMVPFLISSVGVNFRNAVPMLLGVAVIVDAILPKIFKRLTPVVLAVCVGCFMVVSVSEVCDYDLTAKRDLELIERVAEHIPKEADGGFDSVVCSCAAPVRFEQNVEFNDHIISIRGSAWGITGAVKAVAVKK